MINKIPDFNIRETNLEEPTDAKEPQAQDTIPSEAEPLVHATPEYKSGLIAERRLGSQAQEMLLRNQVIDLDEPAPTPLAEKSVPQLVQDAVHEIPERLNATLDEGKKAWSDPGKVLSDAAKEAERRWSDIKAGK